MSFTPSPVEANIYTWAAALIAPTQLIWDGQDAPRPATPFASLQVLTDAAIGEAATDLDATAPIGDDWTEKAAQLTNITARITAYGETASTITREFRAKWGLPSTHAAAQNLGLSVWDMTRSRRVPMPLSQVTEDRSVIDMQIYSVLNATATGQGLDVVEAVLDMGDI